MKKYFFYCVLLFSVVNVYSQVSYKDVILTLDANYIKLASSNGVFSNQNSMIQNYFNASSSLGYFISIKVVMGLSIDFHFIDETSTNFLSINRFVQEEHMNSKSKLILPCIFIGYYYPLSSKLFLDANFKIGFGKIKSEYNSLVMGDAILQVDSSYNVINDPYAIYKKLYSNNSEASYLSFQLLPELSYFISSYFCLSLGFGDIEYSIIDKKPKNSTIIASFKPEYWKLGVKIRI